MNLSEAKESLTSQDVMEVFGAKMFIDGYETAKKEMVNKFASIIDFLEDFPKACKDNYCKREAELQTRIDLQRDLALPALYAVHSHVYQ